MKVNTNIGALVAYNNFYGINSQLEKVGEQLSSGKRINRAADDPAGFSIATRMKARIDSLQVAKTNISNAKSLINIASGGMSNIRGILSDLRALAVKSADTALGTDERNALQAQAQQLMNELDAAVNGTKWQGNKLLDGSADYTFQTGPDTTSRTTWAMSSSLYAADLNVVVSTSAGATANQAAVTVADEDKVSGGSWTIEMTDATHFTYTGPGSITGSGTVDSEVDLSATAGIKFTVASPTSGTFAKGDILSFDATGHVSGNVTGAVQTLGSSKSIGTITVNTEDNINLDGTTVYKRGASSLAEESKDLSNGAATAATIDWDAAAQEKNAYKDGEIRVSFDGANWSLADQSGDYVGTDGAAIVAEAADSFTIDLDGGAAADISVTLDGNAGAGDYVDIDITAGNWTVVSGEGTAVNVFDDGTQLSLDFDGGTTSDADITYSGGRWAENDEIKITSIKHVTGAASAWDTSGIIGDAINMLTDSAARSSINKIDSAVDTVMSAEADVGAMVNRLDYKVTSITTSIENTEAARAELEDADIAQVQMEQSKLQILQQTSLIALQTAMISPQYILQLFQ